MRALFVLLLGAAAASAQPFTVGIKGGVPLTDFVNTVQNVSSTAPNRYIIGATAELRLPFGLGVELDALYRHLNYSAQYQSTATITTSTRTTGNSWEFPLLLKYRFPTPIVRPFVDAGVAWDTLSGLSQTVTDTVSPTRTSTTRTTSTPVELQHNSTMGFVMGAGVDIHALVLHISPEIRYTRWGSEHFNLNGIINSNQNQAEFLVGITF